MNETLLAAVTAQLKLSTGSGVTAASKPRLKEGENRDVAILFLDLKGFTSLSETMDHETLHHLLHDENGVMTSLSRIVDNYNGYIDKFEGDLIMALFGAERASENDAVRAIACAIDLMEVVETVNAAFRQFELQFGARIGVNYGRATIAPDPSGHLTAIGPEVNLASRMESTADVNTIQATESVYRMASNEFEWIALGEKRVKGIDRPILTYRPLRRVREKSERWQRGAWFHNAPLVGREIEFARLKEIWHTSKTSTLKNPRGGAKHLFLDIVGESGVGKSRLIHEFLAQFAEDETVAPLVLKGNTASFAQPPFYLWTAILRSYFAATNETEFSVKWQQLIENTNLSMERLEATQNVLTRVVIGKAFDSGTELQSDDARSEIICAIRDWVFMLTNQNQSLVLVLDDLHWLDSGSQEALEFLLANCDTKAPLFIIGAHREEREDGAPLELILRDKYVDVIELPFAALTVDSISHIANAIARSYYKTDTQEQLPQEAVDLLFRFSQGNPFYAEELVLDWLESKRFVLQDKSWHFDNLNALTQLPASVTALIRSRMDRLPPSERKSLQECSALGMEFSFRLYRAIKEKLSEQTGLEPALQALVFHDYLKTISSIREHVYRFRMSTTRDVAYETALRDNRILLHRLTAEALEEMYPDDREEIAEALFRHWVAAGDWKRALPNGIQALRQYRFLHQTKEARVLDREIEEYFLANVNQQSIFFSIDRMRWLFVSESVAELSGEHDRQQTLLLQIDELLPRFGNDRDHADTALRRGNYYLQIRDFPAANTQYEQALELAEKANDKALLGNAKGNLGLLAMYRKEPDRTVQLFSDAMLLFEEIGDKAGIGKFAANLAGLSYSCNRLEECEKYLTIAEQAFHGCRNRRGVANLAANRASIYAKNANWQAAITAVNRAIELLELIGDKKALGVVRSNHGYYAMQIGEYALAEKSLTFAIEIHEEVNDTTMIETTRKRLAELYRIRGY